MRRKSLFLVLLLLVWGVFASIASNEVDFPQQAEATEEVEYSDEPWVCPEGYEGQTLNVYNWSTYIAEDTIPNFAELCGVTVNYDIFESNESLLTRLQQGNPGYDIIVPTDFIVPTMVREELLMPLDHSLIPNMTNVHPLLLDPLYDPGNVYTFPYLWGTTGVGYSTAAFPDGISSWDDFWSHDGPVAWIEDRRAMLGLALQILGFDPNSENPDEIEEAKNYLIERGGNVAYVAGDDGQELLARGEVDATIEYSGDILQLGYDCECEDYAFVVPAEGATLWVDNLAVPVGAPNPELAMVFIDYILHPQTAADIANYTAYASPNLAAIELELIDAEYLENTAIYPDEEALANLFTIQAVSEDVEAYYNDAWDEILVLLGG